MKRRMTIFLTLCLLSGLALWSRVGRSAAASARSAAVYATINVAAGDVAGLIAAIDTANNETTNPGPDTVFLAGGVYTLTARHNTLYGFTGLPFITSNIIIEGNGAIIERSSAAGTPTFRLMTVAGAGDLHPTTNAALTGGNLTPVRSRWQICAVFRRRTRRSRVAT